MKVFACEFGNEIALDMMMMIMALPPFLPREMKQYDAKN